MPASLYRYLYNPYVLNPHSSMPAYRFMFVTQKISGQPSKDALQLPAPDAPPAGYEVVPTAQAKVARRLPAFPQEGLPPEAGRSRRSLRSTLPTPKS